MFKDSSPSSLDLLPLAPRATTTQDALQQSPSLLSNPLPPRHKSLHFDRLDLRLPSSHTKPDCSHLGRDRRTGRERRGRT